MDFFRNNRRNVFSDFLTTLVPGNTEVVPIVVDLTSDDEDSSEHKVDIEPLQVSTSDQKEDGHQRTDSLFANLLSLKPELISPKSNDISAPELEPQFSQGNSISDYGDTSFTDNIKGEPPELDAIESLAAYSLENETFHNPITITDNHSYATRLSPLVSDCHKDELFPIEVGAMGLLQSSDDTNTVLSNLASANYSEDDSLLKLGKFIHSPHSPSHSTVSSLDLFSSEQNQVQMNRDDLFSMIHKPLDDVTQLWTSVELYSTLNNLNEDCDNATDSNTIDCAQSVDDDLISQYSGTSDCPVAYHSAKLSLKMPRRLVKGLQPPPLVSDTESLATSEKCPSRITMDIPVPYGMRNKKVATKATIRKILKKSCVSHRPQEALQTAPSVDCERVTNVHYQVRPSSSGKIVVEKYELKEVRIVLKRLSQSEIFKSIGCSKVRRRPSLRKGTARKHTAVVPNMLKELQCSEGFIADQRYASSTREEKALQRLIQRISNNVKDLKNSIHADQACTSDKLTEVGSGEDRLAAAVENLMPRVVRKRKQNLKSITHNIHEEGNRSYPTRFSKITHVDSTKQSVANVIRQKYAVRRNPTAKRGRRKRVDQHHDRPSPQTVTGDPNLHPLVLKALRTKEGGEPILQVAVKCLHQNSLRYCISQFPHLINERDVDGKTALHEALSRRNETAVRMLLEAGADCNSASMDDGKRPLHTALESGVSLDTVKRLVEHGADVDYPLYTGDSVLSLTNDPHILSYLDNVSHGLAFNNYEFDLRPGIWPIIFTLRSQVNNGFKYYVLARDIAKALDLSYTCFLNRFSSRISLTKSNFEDIRSRFVPDLDTTDNVDILLDRLAPAPCDFLLVEYDDRLRDIIHAGRLTVTAKEADFEEQLMRGVDLSQVTDIDLETNIPDEAISNAVSKSPNSNNVVNEGSSSVVCDIDTASSSVCGASSTTTAPCEIIQDDLSGPIISSVQNWPHNKDQIRSPVKQIETISRNNSLNILGRDSDTDTDDTEPCYYSDNDNDNGSFVENRSSHNRSSVAASSNNSVSRVCEALCVPYISEFVAHSSWFRKRIMDCLDVIISNYVVICTGIKELLSTSFPSAKQKRKSFLYQHLLSFLKSVDDHRSVLRFHASVIDELRLFSSKKLLNHTCNNFFKNLLPIHLTLITTYYDQSCSAYEYCGTPSSADMLTSFSLGALRTRLFFVRKMIAEITESVIESEKVMYYSMIRVHKYFKAEYPDVLNHPLPPNLLKFRTSRMKEFCSNNSLVLVDPKQIHQSKRLSPPQVVSSSGGEYSCPDNVYRTLTPVKRQVKASTSVEPDSTIDVDNYTVTSASPAQTSHPSNCDSCDLCQRINRLQQQLSNKLKAPATNTTTLRKEIPLAFKPINQKSPSSIPRYPPTISAPQKINISNQCVSISLTPSKVVQNGWSVLKSTSAAFDHQYAVSNSIKSVQPTASNYDVINLSSDSD